MRDRWPNQVLAKEQLPDMLTPGTSMVVTSPTGTGKGQIMADQIMEFRDAVLYTHRKLLLTQLSAELDDFGIRHGIRAAGHSPDLSAPVQLASIQTTLSRSIKKKKIPLPKARLVLIDECHLHREAGIESIIDAHLETGAAVLGVTATPLDIWHLYDKLFIAGTMSMGRECGAIVPAIVYAPDEPDCRNLKRTPTGEYTEGDAVKKIMSATIIGRVIDNYWKINPEQRPTVLFAPGVDESLWFADQLRREGIPSAHIDGERVWIDGVLQPSNEKSRKEVETRMASGEIKVVCNRFVMREGINWRFLKHAIMATVVGGLGTWLQMCGRTGRAFGGAKFYTIQDHGGNYHRHGSPNSDREWAVGDSSYIIGELREDGLREKTEPEPIVCPKCHAVRASGSHCPICKHIHEGRTRLVVQQNGTLKEVRGDLYQPRRVDTRPTAEKEWIACYWRAKKSANGMTFNQAAGLFASEHNGAYPPAGLPYMPRRKVDWYSRVADVPYSELIPNPDFKPKASAATLFSGGAA